MSRRKAGLPWAPTSLAPIRDQWCAALGEGLDQLRDQPATAALLPQAEDDLAGIAASTLYWVARDMVDLAIDAAASLPEWSPAAAIPAAFGLLAWAKPPAVFDWPVPGGSQRVRMPVDAMAWGIRDGQVGVSCAFRSDRLGEQLGNLFRHPLLSHTVGVWDLEEPVAHLLDDGAISPLSVLGCAWLLMGQPTVATTRQIRTGRGGSTDDAAADDGAVSIIELRKIAAGDAGETERGSGDRRGYDKRFWVSGHWRQQACGPGRKLRKPLWISPPLEGTRRRTVGGHDAGLRLETVTSCAGTPI